MDTAKMSVEEIRGVLVANGMTQEDAGAIKGKSNLVAKLNEIAGEVVPQDELNDKIASEVWSVEGNVQAPAVPARNSALWHDYVMTQFAEDELVEDPKTKNKLPTVDGLRRVAQDLVGIITSSYGAVDKAPTADDRTATVNYMITIHTGERLLRFGGIADTSIHNIDGDFARYLTSIAETRAEARALRKALGLKKTVAAEEVISPVSDSDFKPQEKITDMQITVIDKGCKQNDIDVLKFMNSGELKYNSIKDVEYKRAISMCAYLAEYARGSIAIPDSIRGYDANWRQ